jgi:hypothetical protein
MNDVALKRRIAALMIAAFLSVMGATLAAVTGADSADARAKQCTDAGCIGIHGGG